MNKANIYTIVISALAIGALIGYGVYEPADADKVSTASATTPSQPDQTGNVLNPLHFAVLSKEEMQPKHDDFGRPMAAYNHMNFLSAQKPWKSETFTIEIPVDGSVEYKLIMDEKDAAVFNWSSDNGAAYFDLHAHQQNDTDGFFTRYSKGEASENAGVFIAPYQGQHGWYWMNISENPITITVNVAGFYDEIVEVEMASE